MVSGACGKGLGQSSCSSNKDFFIVIITKSVWLFEQQSNRFRTNFNNLKNFQPHSAKILSNSVKIALTNRRHEFLKIVLQICVINLHTFSQICTDSLNFAQISEHS